MHLLFRKNAVFALITLSAFSIIACKKDKQDEQAPPETIVPVISVNIPNISTGTGPLEQTLSISSNAKWTAIVPEANTSWISIDKSSGENNSVIRIAVKANTSNDARSGKVILKTTGLADLEIPVAQKGLIEWRKTIPSNHNSQLFEVEDGFIAGGEKDGNIYFTKVNKTTFELIKAQPVTVTGYLQGKLIDMEKLPAGGFIAAAYIDQTTTGSARDVYVFKLNANLEVVQGVILDFGSSQDIPFAIHPHAGTFLLAYTSDGYNYITRLHDNLTEVDGAGKEVSVLSIGDLKINSSDQIFIGGNKQNGKLVVARYSTGLDFQTEFVADFAGTANSLCISADNTVAVAGDKISEGNFEIFAAKLNGDLSLIPGTSFSINHGPWNLAKNIIALKGGGYAISGMSMDGGSRNAYSLILGNDFSTTSRREVMIPFDYLYEVLASLPLEDGSYLVAGSNRSSSATNSSIIRINP